MRFIVFSFICFFFTIDFCSGTIIKFKNDVLMDGQKVIKIIEALDEQLSWGCDDEALLLKKLYDYCHQEASIASEPTLFLKTLEHIATELEVSLDDIKIVLKEAVIFDGIAEYFFVDLIAQYHLA